MKLHLLITRLEFQVKAKLIVKSYYKSNNASCFHNLKELLLLQQSVTISVHSKIFVLMKINPKAKSCHPMELKKEYCVPL